MTNGYTFIDFDGVILDLEERMLKRKFNIEDFGGLIKHHDYNEKIEVGDYMAMLINDL